MSTRKVINYSILPEAKDLLSSKAQELGLSASRLLELVILGLVPSPFGDHNTTDLPGSTRESSLRRV